MLVWLTTLAWADPAVREEPTTFRCCDDATVTRVVEAMVRLHGALAGGEGNLSPFVDALGVEARKLSLAGADGSLALRLNEAVARIRPRTPGSALTGFRTLGPLGVLLALSHEGGALEVAEAGCDGWTWLQRPDRSPGVPSCTAATWR